MKLSNTTKISHFIILFLICCSFNTLAINNNFLPPDSIKPDTTRPQKIIYQYDTLIVISCPQPGESFYGQDSQFDGVQFSFQNNNDGTVSDLNTGLIWQQFLFEDKLT